MEDWKIRVQYLDRYDVILDLSKSKALKKFRELKESMFEKQIVWCELIFDSIENENEVIVDSFENKVVSLFGYNIVF